MNFTHLISDVSKLMWVDAFHSWKWKATFQNGFIEYSNDIGKWLYWKAVSMSIGIFKQWMQLITTYKPHEDISWLKKRRPNSLFPLYSSAQVDAAIQTNKFLSDLSFDYLNYHNTLVVGIYMECVIFILIELIRMRNPTESKSIKLFIRCMHCTWD